MQGRTKVIGVLGALILITLVPFLAARYVLNHEKAGQFKKRNHGEFVQMVHLKDLQVLEGNVSHELPVRKWAGRWLLLYDTHGYCCDSQCQRGVENLHRIRIASHNGIERSVVALLLPDHCPAPSLAKSDHLWRLTPQNQRVWQGTLADKEPQVFIVDPNGWVVLKYPGDVTPRWIYEDFRVLLHTSQIG
jgi:hypothetical protein